MTPADLAYTPSHLKTNQSINAIHPIHAQIQGYSTYTRSAEDPNTHDITRASAILQLRQPINEFTYSAKNTNIPWLKKVHAPTANGFVTFIA